MSHPVTPVPCAVEMSTGRKERVKSCHPVPLPQTRAFPWVFQLNAEEWHYLQDILPQDIKVRVVVLSWTNPFTSISWCKLGGRASAQPDPGSKGFVRAGQAGVQGGENIPSPFAIFSRVTSSFLAPSAQLSSWD